MANREEDENVLSRRAIHSVSFENFRRLYASQVRLEAYDVLTNPKGYIDLGTAENKLVEEVINRKLEEPLLQKVESFAHYYFEYHGMRSFRETVADFLQERLKARQVISSDNIIVTSGVGSALDLLAYSLADPGECFLSPTPYYTRIKTDMGERGQVQMVDVHLTSQDHFQLSVNQLDLAYHTARKKGLVVKGVVLINPHNPLGTIYSKQLVTDILIWAKSLKLHVIIDEIYALSVWDPEAEFVSVASLEHLPDPTRTHLLWGFSKDFSLSGFRAGVLLSWNLPLINAIKTIMYFAAVPAIVQYKLQCILKDKDWLDNVYFPANLGCLREAFGVIKAELEKLSLPYVTPKSGFFIWVDLSKYLNPKTEESQKALFLKILAEKLYIEPANGFYSNQVGWFRICFGYPRYWVEEGMKRLGRALEAVDITAVCENAGAVASQSEDSIGAEHAGDSDSLEGLLGSLQSSIRSSDWLSATTMSGQTWAEENPDAAEEFKKALEGLNQANI